MKVTLEITRRSIKRAFFGESGVNTGVYIGFVVALSMLLAGVNRFILSDGWWSPPGPTNGLVLLLVFIGAVAGYNRYGVLAGIVAASLPLFALLSSGAYYSTTLEYPPSPPPTPIEYLSGSLVFAVVLGVLLGGLGYALGSVARVAREKVGGAVRSGV